MPIRTRYSSAAALSRITGRFTSKQNLFSVWAIVLTLLIQQSAIARISPISKPGNHSVELALAPEAGSTFLDPMSGARVVRVTDTRDGQAALMSDGKGSTFNANSTRFILNLDGVATIYGLDRSTLAIHKRGQLSGTGLQSDSCTWSAIESDTILGLESSDSARIHAYDTVSGANTVLKDFSDTLGRGEASRLSKSWSDDNCFAFSWQAAESSSRVIVVWDRVTDTTYSFDLAHQIAGVPGFERAYVNRSGEALIVDGQITRVWRYRSQPQSESVQLEDNGDSRGNDSFEIFGATRDGINLPGDNFSPDGRFSIFGSHTSGSRVDVFIAAVSISASPSSISWTNIVNCTANGNSLAKTGGVDQADDAYATSAQAALSGDAYVEFTADRADKERWCGLNNSNAIHRSASDINFAIKLTSNKKANVVENGVVRAKIKYKPGYTFRVAVESGAVNYYRNGEIFYTSTARPSYPLMVNASLVDTMSTVAGVLVALTTVGTVVSISPAKASMTSGETGQFTALVTGATDTIFWSATGGAMGTGGFFTAPAAPGTYTVKAACTSNASISASATVTVTAVLDTTAPIITAVASSGVTASGAIISWNTNEPSDTQVEYGATSSYGTLSTQNPALTTSHSVGFGGLTAGQIYHYRVRSRDAAFNTAVSGDFTFTTTGGADTMPPVITGVSASGVTINSANLGWTTNEASNTQVEYGTTIGYGLSTVLNASMVTAHSSSLSGLSAGTLYHYRVKSKDAAGNLATSGDFTFTTISAGDTTPPSLSGVSASSVAANTATIGWTTNEASDTQVEYGTSTGYGSSTALNAPMVTAHSAFVSGLAASTLYHYRVKSKDSAANLAVSGDFTFTTLAAPAPPAPTPSGVITDKNVYSEPAPPALPRAGGTFVDPTFGTTIMRVTDETDGNSNYNYYSYWPTFNLDSSRFFIACDGSPMLYRFDAANFRIISKGPLFDKTLPGGGYISTEDAEWSGTNPNVLYGYYGLQLWAYDVSARTYTLVKDFTGELPVGYLGQMSRSLDDNVFAFTKKDPNWTPTGYVVWRRDQNRILANVTLSNFDEVEMDKTGRYLVVKAEFGGSIDFQVWDLQGGGMQSLTDPAPDYSPGHSDNGRGIVVGHDNWNNQYTIRSLATPHQYQKVISFGSDWSQANHISMLGDDEGWCLISNFTNGSGPLGPFRQEIFQASTDGSQSVRRLAHHHSVYRDYWDTPRGDISRDGRFVAFTSNWGSATRRDVFIIRVPQGGSSSGTPDTTAPTISSVGASSINASSASISWNTNEASDTQVEYGTTSAYGSATGLSTGMVTSHGATINSLAGTTLYHYRVRSKDAAGNQAVSGDFTFTTSGGGASSTQNVTWASVVNCAVSGNSLQKNAGRDDESDGGAVSQQQIVYGDGYVQFTAGVTDKIRFCGLTHSASGTAYAAIDFAIKLTEFGVAEVRENNVYQTDTTYTATDVFRVSIEGGVVKYYKNGAVFYTSKGTPSYPLRVDAAMLNLNGTVNNAVIGAGPGGSLAMSLMRGGDELACIVDWHQSPIGVEPEPLHDGLTVEARFHRRLIG